VNDLQIKLLEGPDSLFNFALPKKFEEHLSLLRPGRWIWEELEYQRIITSQSVVELSMAKRDGSDDGKKGRVG